jgi:hypothetical protein
MVEAHPQGLRERGAPRRGICRGATELAATSGVVETAQLLRTLAATVKARKDDSLEGRIADHVVTLARRNFDLCFAWPDAMRAEQPHRLAGSCCIVAARWVDALRLEEEDPVHGPLASAESERQEAELLELLGVPG